MRCVFNHRGKPVDRLAVRPRDQVPVGIHGDLDGMFPPICSLTGVVFVGKTKVNVCAGIVGQVFAADD
jgi:hypothetical protein